MCDYDGCLRALCGESSCAAVGLGHKHAAVMLHVRDSIAASQSNVRVDVERASVGADAVV